MDKEVQQYLDRVHESDFAMLSEVEPLPMFSKFFDREL